MGIFKFLKREKDKIPENKQITEEAIVPKKEIADVFQWSNNVETKVDEVVSDKMTTITNDVEVAVAENLSVSKLVEDRVHHKEKKKIYHKNTNYKEELESQKWNKSFLKRVIEHPSLRQALEEGNRKILYAVKIWEIEIDPIQNNNTEKYPNVEKWTFLAKILWNYVAYYALEHLWEDSLNPIFSPENYLESIRTGKELYNDWQTWANLYDIAVLYWCDVERYKYVQRSEKYIRD